MSENIQTKDLNEFHAWVRAFARGLQGDELILLSGPMGAGKTEFVKTLAQAMGATEPASSPTYAFHQTYALLKGSLDHWDIYRVKSEEDLESVAFWDLLASAKGLVCVEWPERAGGDDVWPLGRRIVRIAIKPAGAGREITVHELRHRG